MTCYRKPYPKTTNRHPAEVWFGLDTITKYYSRFLDKKFKVFGWDECSGTTTRCNTLRELISLVKTDEDAVITYSRGGYLYVNCHPVTY